MGHVDGAPTTFRELSNVGDCVFSRDFPPPTTAQFRRPDSRALSPVALEVRRQNDGKEPLSLSDTAEFEVRQVSLITTGSKGESEARKRGPRESTKARGSADRRRTPNGVVPKNRPQRQSVGMQGDG